MKKLFGISLVVMLYGCASSGPVPIGKDTYLIFKDNDFFAFSGNGLKAELFREGNQFCLQQGKQFQPVRTRHKDSGMASYAAAEIEFRCLSERDPEYGRPNLEREADVTVRVK